MILQVDGIDTYYGETQALFGASLACERGKVFALLGPNGAGKTTMLRSILGLTRAAPRRDPVRRPRRDAQSDPRDRPRRHRLGARRPATLPDADGGAQSAASRRSARGFAPGPSRRLARYFRRLNI